MEKKRSILSLCIAMALSGNSWAADTNDINSNEQQTINCSDDSSKLSAADKEKFSAQCPKDDGNLLEWVAAGFAAVGAAVGIAVYNDDDGGSHTSADTGPTPPNPDDGGDDGGDPTPPNPDDGGDDGGDPTPPAPSFTTYNNNVTLDTGTQTLTFDTVTLNGESWNNVTFHYVQDGDNYVLTAPDGRTLVINQKYVTNENNAVMGGVQPASGYYWKYDSEGKFWFATAETKIIDQDGASNTLADNTTASGNDAIGVIISG
ncbi:BigA family surface-exposed virulence protein, partial [Trabulsiella guamensis ATCC 49490]